MQPYIFDTIIQIQWYYDEVIVYDPLIFMIYSWRNGTSEAKKQHLLDLISLLSRFKESISNGFILFVSYHTLSQQLDNIFSLDYQDLIESPDIRNELDKLVSVFKMEAPNRDRLLDYTIAAEYRGTTIFSAITQEKSHINKNQGGPSAWNIDFVGSNYSELTVNEVKELGVYDKIFNGFKNEFSTEIKEILKYYTIGSSINTPIFYNRTLDKLILSSVFKNDPEINQQIPQDHYELTLPFVGGIPPERLFDLREKIPSAFSDFRNTMFEIILDLQQQGFKSEVLEFKINQRVSPILKRLDSEIRSSLQKAMILGYGTPIALGIGALGLWQLGLDITKIGGIVLGGISVPSELRIITNRLTEKNASQANPFYFLWKVQHSK